MDNTDVDLYRHRDVVAASVGCALCEIRGGDMRNALADRSLRNVRSGIRSRRLAPSAALSSIGAATIRTGKGVRTSVMARLVPKIRVLVGAVVAIGPGKADLLQAIADHGSISAAARGMGMSYRRAWLLVEGMNNAFRRPLVETLTGGDGGGGARLTETGKEVLRRYRAMEARAARAVAAELRGFSQLLRPQSTRRRG